MSVEADGSGTEMIWVRTTLPAPQAALRFLSEDYEDG